jgi:hypothetical protein
MAINAAFNPQSATFLVASNATPSTASAQLVSFNPTLTAQPAAQASGLQACPSQVRVVNTGTVVVYISFTSALRVAVVPGANPGLELPVLPGVERVFTLQQVPNALSATPYALQVNTISTVATQNLLVTFGEGQ